MRLLSLLLLCGCIGLGASVESASKGDADSWARKGRDQFEVCQFKEAARDFSRAVRYRPRDASLHHWLGESYAHLAEVSSTLTATRQARRAQFSLERAVELEPANRLYLRDLFHFYLDSPEWFSGGLARAALLVERVEPSDPGAQSFLRSQLADAGHEFSGVDWRAREITLVPSRELGRMVP
jgi:tetratricopeptide (TPR) repeat protein